MGDKFVLAGQVDVWALGISAIEMAEIKPPRWAVHPMRVIFMISREPPPRLANNARWSLTLQNFVATCLQKVSTGCWSRRHLASPSTLECQTLQGAIAEEICTPCHVTAVLCRHVMP